MRKMTEGNITTHLLAYAIPLILGNIFQLTYNAVDSIIIGKFAGENALAAVGAANPVMTIVILGVSGICIGASVLMSNFYGAGKMEDMRKEIATTIIFGMLFSMAMLLLGILSSKYILMAMNVPGKILNMAEIYLQIIFIGFPFTFLYNALSASLRSAGDSRTPVIFLALSSVLNGCLDMVFVSGFHWGVSGAGAATVIAEGVSVLLCVWYTCRHVPEIIPRKSERRMDRELLKKTLQHGSVTALQQSCQPIGKVLIQSVINAQGISMIAAYNAVNRVDDFACIPTQSISHGMMTCVAQNRGAHKDQRVWKTFRTGICLELGYWVCIGITTLLFKENIMKLFAAEKESQMVAAGTEYLTIMAFLYMLPGMTNALQGFFRGMERMTVTLIGTVIQISIRVIVVFILVPIMGISGAAYACGAGWGIMLLYEVPYYLYCRKHV